MGNRERGQGSTWIAAPVDDYDYEKYGRKWW
jgi:hypothetical protein